MNRFDRLPHIAARYAARDAVYRPSGLWRDETIPEFFRDAVARQPEQPWRFWFAAQDEIVETSLGEIAAEADSFARRLLADPAATPDTVIAVDVPNSPCAVSSFFGALQAGLIAFPVSLREGEESLAELLQMVGASQLVLTEDDDERIAWAKGYLRTGQLDRIWLGDRDGRLRSHSGRSEQAASAPMNTQDGVHVISYTSGSTSTPKVVLYTDAQLLSEIHGLRLTIESRGGLLVPSPVGHITGVLNLLLMPLERPDQLVSMDRWNAEKAVELTRRFGCSELRGTTLYFQQMVGLTDDLGGLKAGMAGGGPVAPSIVRRCEEAGTHLVRSYGSTEHPTVCNCFEGEPLQIRSLTDGRPTPGTELKLLSEDGQQVPTGTPGEIFSRGPDAMAGYLDPELHNEFVTSDGWFRTSDVGILNELGYITISDRIKDIIIRGAENISAKEVEDLIHEWSLVEEVSVVGIPDPVYGERACAFIQPRDVAVAVDLDGLRDYLATTRLEKFKWPERVEIVKGFPRTASGKVRKQTLRDDFLGAIGDELGVG